MEERIIELIGKEKFAKIEKTKILLIGLGGVGGYAFESLVRSGFKRITVADFDTFEKTNMNRQIYATEDSLNQNKCIVAQKRALKINPTCQITTLTEKIIPEQITEKFLEYFDYILDACDDVLVKVALIKACKNAKKKLISCMGTANRTHPELLSITTLEKTTNDPLAKKLRDVFKKTSYLKTKVVWSSEVPVKQKKLGTLCPVPMSAGSLLCSYILNEILKEEN